MADEKEIRVAPSFEDRAASDLVEVSSTSTTASDTATKESEAFSAARESTQTEKWKLENNRIRDDHDIRCLLAKAIPCLVAAWLVFVAVVVALSIPLSDSVLIALLTTTTVNVIGLFVIVAKYFFYQPK